MQLITFSYNRIYDLFHCIHYFIASQTTNFMVLIRNQKMNPPKIVFLLLLASNFYSIVKAQTLFCIGGEFQRNNSEAWNRYSLITLDANAPKYLHKKLFVSYIYRIIEAAVIMRNSFYI